jgi:hypothetical protein
MAKHFEYDNESEIRDIIGDEVSDILSETSPLLSEVNTSTPHYKDTKLHRLVLRFTDTIYRAIESQLDGIKEDASNKIGELIDARDTHCSKSIDLEEDVKGLEEKLTAAYNLIDKLEEENQLFREGKHGTVHGAKFDI